MEDLFESPQQLPSHIKTIIDKYDNGDNEMDYMDLEDMKEEMELNGYTFDYYLDGVPFNLRKIK